jgi:glucose-6-phosphate-specific signal transduction histidine kinase
MLGGTLTRDSQAGTKLTISIPLKQKPLNIEVSPS